MAALAVVRSAIESLLTAARPARPFHQLADPNRYLAEIDRLHAKLAQRRGLYDLRQDGVPFSQASLDRGRLARLLAKTVGRGKYRLQPGEARTIRVKDKERVVYAFRMTDRIVHGAVSSLLVDIVRPAFVPGLYSYVQGKSWCDALSDFARYVRAHRKSRPDPRDRGLYVLRRDVRAYTDTIPVGDRSPLWPVLEELLDPEGVSGQLSDATRRLLRDIIRPEILVDGRLATRYRGVPTGSPISTFLFNAYLTPLDRYLDGIPDGFHARYSDDFLFAHPDPEVVRKVAGGIDEILTALQLTTNAGKDEALYFNGAARTSREWPEISGASSIDFLGCRVAFDATVSLGRHKIRQLLRDLGRRAARTRRVVASSSIDVAGPLVCRAVNAALDPDGRARQRSAVFLRRFVTDRRQLRELDHRIARIVVRALTGEAGPRGFRKIPYRRLRRDWQLVSLFHARNRGSSRH